MGSQHHNKNRNKNHHSHHPSSSNSNSRAIHPRLSSNSAQSTTSTPTTATTAATTTTAPRTATSTTTTTTTTAASRTMSQAAKGGPAPTTKTTTSKNDHQDGDARARSPKAKQVGQEEEEEEHQQEYQQREEHQQQEDQQHHHHQQEEHHQHHHQQEEHHQHHHQQEEHHQHPIIPPNHPSTIIHHSPNPSSNSLKNRHPSQPTTAASNSAHRESPRASPSNRRSSSNSMTTTTVTNTALRHQHHQAQAQARAHAHAHAHLRAQLQAHAQAHHQLSYYQQHMADLANYITQVFLPSVLPTPEEYQIKEQTRQYLETLADRVSKGARLLPFGSIASGLALRNSDMDLCYLADPGHRIDAHQDQPASDHPSHPNLDHSSVPITGSSTLAHATQTNDPHPDDRDQTTRKPKPSPAEMVMILGKLIQEETAFMVKMLPKARIPIIKLSLPPSLGQPFGLSCDIGFENRLALENTRLLLTYAMVDPRMRTMVLFLKVWSKRRRINDPYLGTLSSYGYVLMVIYYLVNGRKLAVLPNLQQLPPPRVTSPEESVYEGHDIYFFDDLDALPRFWSGMNRENVGELLIEFFRFFSSSFRYTHDVISVRSPGGLVTKESKGWMNDIIEEAKEGRGGYLRIDLNRLCIEDPFQTEYNVARTVTRDGLFTIRGEFMRAVRVLSTRTDRLDVMIRELCEERQEGVLMAPPSSSGRRKSAPNPKAPPSMNLSGSTSHTRVEEEEDDLEEQLLLQQQQQQQALLSAQQQPSYPPLTTQLMQDHIYSQATTSMDARPRYPPESIASEPPPLDRDLDWNHESMSNYSSHDIQQLQMQSHPPRPSHSQSFTHPTPSIPDSFKASQSATTTPSMGSQQYFHRFFQTTGSDNFNPQPSTSGSLGKINVSPLPTYFYDHDQLEANPPVSPTSVPKHSNPHDFNQEEFGGTNSHGIPTVMSSKPRYNSQTIKGSHGPRSISHNPMNSRRRSEQPQSSNLLLNPSGLPLIMPHSSNGRMPDFSLLPLPGPIRFGNFGTAEKLWKQKLENHQRILGRSIPASYYGHPNGFASSSSFHQDFTGSQAVTLSQDRLTPQRIKTTTYSIEGVDEPTSQVYSNPRQAPDQPRDAAFLAVVQESTRRRSLSNGTSSRTSSSTFNRSSHPRSPIVENEEDRRQGVETPRARLNQSLSCVGNQSSYPSQSMGENFDVDRSSSHPIGSSYTTTTSLLARCMPSSSSLPQLPRKIVFGDVEVSTETAKEVRVKALAAVLRTRRMGGSLNDQVRKSENVSVVTDEISGVLDRQSDTRSDAENMDGTKILNSRSSGHSTGHWNPGPKGRALEQDLPTGPDSIAEHHQHPGRTDSTIPAGTEVDRVLRPSPKSLGKKVAEDCSADDGDQEEGERLKTIRNHVGTKDRKGVGRYKPSDYQNDTPGCDSCSSSSGNSNRRRRSSSHSVGINSSSSSSSSSSRRRRRRNSSSSTSDDHQNEAEREEIRIDEETRAENDVYRGTRSSSPDPTEAFATQLEFNRPHRVNHPGLSHHSRSNSRAASRDNHRSSDGERSRSPSRTRNDGHHPPSLPNDRHDDRHRSLNGRLVVG